MERFCTMCSDRGLGKTPAIVLSFRARSCSLRALTITDQLAFALLPRSLLCVRYIVHPVTHCFYSQAPMDISAKSEVISRADALACVLPLAPFLYLGGSPSTHRKPVSHHSNSSLYRRTLMTLQPKHSQVQVLNSSIFTNFLEIFSVISTTMAPPAPYMFTQNHVMVNAMPCVP
jgi:hypothetical protein